MTRFSLRVALFFPKSFIMTLMMTEIKNAHTGMDIHDRIRNWYIRTNGKFQIGISHSIFFKKKKKKPEVTNNDKFSQKNTTTYPQSNNIIDKQSKAPTLDQKENKIKIKKNRIRAVIFMGVFLRCNKPSSFSGLPEQKLRKGWVDFCFAWV